MRVKLSVKGQVDNGAAMYAVGNCPQLGQWKSKDALLLECQQEAEDDVDEYVLISYYLLRGEPRTCLIDNASTLDIILWTLSVPAVFFYFKKIKKDSTNPKTYKYFYLQLITKYPLWEKMFTNGLKTDGGAAEAAVFIKHSWKPFTCHLPDL